MGERNWVNPSPNAANLSMARAYAGTVMLEGTTLSEGRGTTRPLELLGAPGLEPRSLLTAMDRIMPAWMKGCRLRPCWFEPTFQKHSGKLCAGFQIHVEDGAYSHGEFRPWRLIAGAFKCIRRLRGEYPLWRDFPVRVRNIAPRHRSHQRQRPAASVGGRSGGDSGRSDRSPAAGRSRLGRTARRHPAVSLIPRGRRSFEISPASVPMPRAPTSASGGRCGAPRRRAP